MKFYSGIDVSLDSVSVYIVDETSQSLKVERPAGFPPRTLGSCHSASGSVPAGLRPSALRPKRPRSQIGGDQPGRVVAVESVASLDRQERTFPRQYHR